MVWEPEDIARASTTSASKGGGRNQIAQCHVHSGKWWRHWGLQSFFQWGPSWSHWGTELSVRNCSQGALFSCGNSELSSSDTACPDNSKTKWKAGIANGWREVWESRVWLSGSLDWRGYLNIREFSDGAGKSIEEAKPVALPLCHKNASIKMPFSQKRQKEKQSFQL